MGDHEKAAEVIRREGSSQDVDLANYDSSAAAALIFAAFSRPIQCQEMIRISFLVGGGKKVRQKYSPTLPKDVSAALQGLEYEEDKGASLDISSAGSFKYQHNTDTDLKTIHVFPKVEIVKDDNNQVTPGSLSPTQMCIEADLDLFISLVKTKATSFGQKRSLLTELKTRMELIDKIDQKLIAMEAMTPEEEELYNGAKQMAEKIGWLQAECQTHIDTLQLTKTEMSHVIESVDKKIKKLSLQIIEVGDNEKKRKKLEDIKLKLAEQIDKIRAGDPIKRTIKHELDIAKLEALADKIGMKMENNTATLDDMSERNKALRKIDTLKAEQEDLYWFDNPNMRDPVKLPKTSKPKSKGSASGSSSWSTVSANKSKSQPTKNKGRQTGNAFAGLAID
eukprot:m.163395 g.163395  ORF g.163395 m.163395 type:complete len:393 (-) comp15217_c1_seq3:1730-2908(-)